MTIKIEELKEQIKATNIEKSKPNSLDNSLYFENGMGVGNKVIDIEKLSPTRNYANKVIELVERQRYQRTESLQHELFMDPEDEGAHGSGGSPNGRRKPVVPLLKLSMKNANSLEDEEFFEGQSTLRSQYRFETTEDDMLNQSDMEANGGCYNNYRMTPDNGLATPPKRLSSFSNEIKNDQAPNNYHDSELEPADGLRSELAQETSEKNVYRKLYLEL